MPATSPSPQSSPAMPLFGTRGLLYYSFAAYICVACTCTLLRLLPLSTLLPTSIGGQNTVETSDVWGNSNLYWSSSRSSIYKQRFLRSHPTTESLFLSKAFELSMQPSRVIPFYFRATGIGERIGFPKEDITITTIVTSNRFSVLGKLARRYQGPISVTVHVSDATLSHRNAILDELHDLYRSSPAMSTWVDVHVVLDNFDRQFNMWRNAARLFARTDYVMMLDVDFAVCTDFRKRLLGSEVMLQKLREGYTAFVIPAFEFVLSEDGMDDSTFPRSKKELNALYNNGKIQVFHQAWESGHNSSDYGRYFQAAPGDVYKVLAYQHAYEPYVVFKREGPHWCDERFIGYGGNKASCLYEMYLSGISFFVLSDDFLIHQSHIYAEDIRKAERRYNRQLYIDFRIEACLRSLHRSIVTKELTSPRGTNVHEECRKIRGASALGTELVQALA